MYDEKQSYKMYPSPTRLSRTASDLGAYFSGQERGRQTNTSRELISPSKWLDEDHTAIEFRKQGGQKPPCVVCRHGVKPYDATLPQPCLHGPVHAACMMAEERLSLATTAATGRTTAPQLYCAVCYQPVTAIAYNLTDEIPSTRLPFSQFRTHLHNISKHQPSAPPIDELIISPPHSHNHIKDIQHLVQPAIFSPQTTTRGKRPYLEDDGKDEKVPAGGSIRSREFQEDMRLHVDVHVIHHHHHYTRSDTKHNKKHPHRKSSKSRVTRAHTNKTPHNAKGWSSSKHR